MNIPAELKYTKDHEWVRLEGDVAVVGITDFAQSELGDIVFVDIQTEGETLAKEEVFGTIEAVKTVADAFMPVYGEGWMIKIKYSDPSEFDTLLSAAQYEQII